MNDSRLTDDLSVAFRDATKNMTYGGKMPSPRPGMRVTVPALLSIPALVAGVGVAALVAPLGTSQVAGPPSGATSLASPSQAKASEITTIVRTFNLAGYELTVSQQSDRARLYGQFVSAVPSDATEVSASVFSGTAFIGVDPATGYNAVFVTDPDDNKVWELTSSDITADELKTIINADSIEPVPVVEGDASTK